MSIKRAILGILVLLAVTGGAFSVTTASAGSNLETYSWNHVQYKPGCCYLSFSGNGGYGAWWTTNGGFNTITYRHGGSSICPAHADISAGSHWLFYSGSTLSLGHPPWQSGLVVPGGCTGTGGNTVASSVPYSVPPSGKLRHASAFNLCDGAGCYGGKTMHAAHDRFIW